MKTKPKQHRKRSHAQFDKLDGLLSAYYDRRRQMQEDLDKVNAKIQFLCECQAELAKPRPAR